jgi:cytochrome b involved in lipid metabolism
MVYDVTPYIDKHMGGEEAITRYAGQDNTKPFHGDQHPLKVREVIDEFYIGRLAK